MKRQPAARRKPHIEEIEPRILYSADTPLAVLDTQALTEQRTLDASGEFSAQPSSSQSTQAQPTTSHEVVFVDASTPEYQKLVDDIKSQSGTNRQLDVVLLDANSDGIKQISATLAGMKDVSAVHIIGHGADGQIELGGATLNFNSLLKNAAQIKGWGQALTPAADLLIYGCDVAEYADGKALIDALGRLTGADVAASENLTGAADKGGDWNLEYQDGKIETQLAISTAEQGAYDHTLATFTVSNLSDSGAGSLRAAITSANASAGNVIQFSVAGTINLASALPTITQQMTIDATTAPGWAAGKPVVELNGAGAGTGVSGLNLGAGSSGSTIKGLAINRFAQSAIQIQGSSNNVIQGNFLGTNLAGTAASANQVGIFVAGTSTNNLIGGTTAAARNVVSGNSVDGIQLFGAGVTGNTIQGNYVGLNAAGTAAVGNTNQGIAVFSGAANNTIGGTATGAGNVISGNGQIGLRFTNAGTTGNMVQGNYIGTNAAGTAAIGNGQRNVSGLVAGVQVAASAGSETIGGTAAGAGNVISGNIGDGIQLQGTSSGSTVQGNLIGTNAAATGAVSNGLRGIYIDGSSSNTIGGTAAGAANTIANNAAAGIAIVTTSGAATGNTIRGNSVYNNGSLGIDLGNDGATPNDAGDGDAGANKLQNFPTIVGVTDLGGGSFRIDGTFNSTASGTYTIDFYSSPAADASGYGEGKTYLGSMTVATDASGNVQFSKTLSATLSATDVVSAAATDASGNTSEFSPAWAVAPVQIANENGVIARSNALDAAWSSVTGQNIGHSILIDGETSLNALPISANWKALYDSNYVYFLVSVTKPGGPVADGPAGQPWEDDAVELFIDPTYARGTSYAANDVQVVVRPNDSTLYTYQTSGPGPTLSNSGVWTTSSGSTGYTVKLAVKWTDLGLAGAPAAGSSLGVDMHVDDDPGNNGSPSKRIGTLAWSNTIDDASHNPSSFGLTWLGPSVNHAPQGTSNSVTTLENSAYTFATADFGFSDPNDSPANSLNAVKITTLPGAGALTDNGVAVTTGQFVSVADITGGKLKFTPVANANGNSYASFTFKVQDDGGTANGGVNLDPTPRTMTVNVTPVNDAPVLSGANNLTAINEDPSSNSGTLVSALIAGKTSDVDSGAQSGIAVTGVVNTNGAWQYSTNGGTSWTAFGSPGTTTARLLAADANTYVRFVPNANWNGTVSNGLTFRAWDQTSGTAGNTTDTTTNGGTSAFSTATASASITVNSVNDAPAGANKTVTTLEDTAYTFAALDFGFSDASDTPANSLLAVKITTIPAAGSLTDNGVVVSAGQFVSVTDINSGKLIFTPGANANGAGYASFTFQVQDNGGTSNGGVDLDPSARTMTVNVTAVNDAPVLSGSNNLTAINEDPASNAGTLVSALIAGKTSDVDSGALTGIAVTGVVNTNGAWQYSTNGGTSWTAFGSPGTTTARLLAADTNTYVRFVPNANWNGTVSNGLTFRAWDQTSGTAGNTTDTTTNGGTSAFSTATASASITVNSVNDAPAGTNKTVTTLEDTGYTFGTSDFGFSDTSDSPANTLLAVKVTTLPGAGSLTDNGVAVTAGQFVSVTDINSGKLIFTPGANANGAGYASFTFQVQDNGGTGNGGVDLDPSARTMTINVSAVNDAPVLSGSNNLSAINEDPSSNAGTLVSALIAGQTSDVDSAAQSGIAVTGVVNTNGTWQYSTNGGTTWSAFGSPGTTTARLLAADANTYVRFVPNANFNGTVSNGLTFRAWDQTSGTAGNTADTTTNGGTSAFSTATASASITVNSVNDAPAGTNKTVTTLEDTAYTFAALDFGFSDTSDTPANSLLAVKITTLPGAGTLSDNGVAVTAGQFVTVADITGGKLTFTPGANAQGAAYASFTFQVQDDGGVANGGVDLDPSARTMTVNVTGVNDAPQGTSNTVTTLEDNAYTFAAVDFGFSDPNDSPANTLAAVKITTIPGAGTLTDNGVAVSAGQSVTLADISAGKLIFTPGANADGTGYASFTFQVQDSGGVANGGVDTDPVARTMNINVSAVNDAPVLSGADDLSAISENPVANSGTLVSALIVGHVSDADASALSGIAVTAVDNTNGAWQYSTDGGTTWNAFGSPTAATARLLAADANTYVRFVPNVNWSGTVSGGLTFRAWDQTTGTAGATADTTSNGGSSAYSAATASASITVSAVGLPTASNDAYSVNEDGTLSVDWWNSDWSKRSALTLSGNTFVGATNLTDFPVLVTLNSGNFDYSAAKADGSDLRFFDAGGNALAYEIEDWNAAGNSYVWVKVPQVNTTGTQQIQMYYGNLAAADGQNAAAVWTQSYSAVYHLSDSGATINDSANSFDGTATNGPTTAAGQIGSALSFSGASQYVNLGTNLPLLNNDSSVTLSAWVNSGTLAGDETVLAVSRNNAGTPTGSSRAQIILTGDQVQVVGRSTDDDTDTATVTTTDSPFAGQVGQWHFVTGVIDYATNTVKIYIDGVQDTNTTGTANFTNLATPNTNSQDAAIGSNDDGGSAYFVGQIDEARVSTAARSAAWIKAEYLSMTGGFVSVGAAQSASATSGVLANDSDTGSVNFAAALVSGPSHASAFTLNADGTFSYTPTANFAGTDTFTYQAVDAFNTSNTATVTITVNPVNDAPSGANNTVTTLEDASYTFSAVDFGFSDAVDSPSNTLLAVKLTTTPGAGTLSDNGVAVSAGQFVSVTDINSGKLIFTPGANTNGAGYASFTFQLQDNGGTANGGVDLDPSARTMSIDVTPVNDAPALSGSNNLSGINEDPSSNAGTLVSALLLGNVSDVDSGALSGIAVTAVDNANGTWQYSTNGGGTWNAFGAPSTTSARLLAADASTSVRFVPNANFNGTVSSGITFRAWDQTAGVAGGTADTTSSGGTTAYSSATASASITVSLVNDAPSGANNTVTLLEDTAYTFAAADFGFSDTADGPANALLAVKITTTPGAGTLSDNGVAVTVGQFVSVTDINSGKLIFTPGANANGAGYASFTFQVQDDGGTANSGVDLDPSARTMTMNVTAVNDAPQGASNTVTALEDSTYTFAVADFGFSDAVDSPANSLLAVKIGTVPGAGTLSDNGVAVTAGQFVSVADIAGGKLVFTPLANANGAGYASFTFQVQDNGGIANGGVDLDPTARTMNIDVTPVNDAPAGANNSVTTLEDTAYTFAAADFGFSDPVDSPADTLLAVKITTIPGAGTLSDNGVAVTAGQFVSLSDINSGKLSFTPGANANGAGYASFTFQVQDDGGTANSGVDLDPSARTMSINVSAVNDAPAGANNTVTTLEDTAYTFAAVDFGFSDAADSPANALLAVKLSTTPGTGTLTDNGVAVTAGQFVSVSDINTGKLIFTPGANANGAGYASFTFQVQDNGGTVNGGVDLDPSARTMSINVTPVNDAPQGTSNTVTTLEDTGYTFNAVDFGFSDPIDSSADALLAVKLTTLPGAGSLTDNGVVMSAGQFVSVTDITSGKLIFTPGANANGAGYASFTFQVQDNGGIANGGVDLDPTARTMNIDVTPVNDAPAGANNSVTTLEDTAYTFAAADFGFSDPVDSPADTLLAVKITTIPGAGTLSDNGVAVTAGQFVSLSDINSGKLSFTPGANANGAGYASFTFQVQDDGGTANGGVDLDPSARTMSINVTAVNDAAQGANNTVTTLEDTAYTFAAVDFGFSDAADSPANALLAVKLSTTPGTGTLTDNGVAVTAGQFVSVSDINTGKLIFTPGGNANGAGYASFTFQVQDDGGTANGGVDLDPSARTMNIDVTAVNDAPQGTSTTVSTLENTAYAFTAVDFGFGDASDSPANTLLAVRIATLPGAGSLTDNGVAVTAGQFVTLADITTGQLVFTPAVNANGAGYASFTFQVQDDGGTANGGVDTDPTARMMTINVTTVNNAPTGADNTVTTLEDTDYVFGTVDFGFTDPGDSPANSLAAVKVTTLPSAGSLADNGVAVTAGQFVSVADIAGGKLIFTPGTNANGAAYAGFGFQVQDNGGTAGGGVDLDPTVRTMTIDVSAVDDAPVLSNNTLTIAQGGSLILSSANLSATDVDTPVASLTFTVSNVTNGRFELAASPGVPVFSFTQAAIGAGQVRFVQNGSAAVPSYDVAVSDGTTTLPPSPVTIGSFVPTPVAPPTIQPVVALVAPMPVFVPAPQVTSISQADAPAPTASEQAPAPTGGNEAATDGGAATAAGGAGPVLSGGRPVVAEPVGTEMPVATHTAFVRLESKLTRVSLNPAPELVPAEMGLQIQGSDPTYMQFGPSTLASWSASTAFPDEGHGKERDQIQIIMETVEMGGIALSVGVVWWASRVGGLIGSLLASMPAWRHLDPLPIVGRDEEEEQWYENQDADADADELAVSMVLEGGGGARTSAAA